MAHRFGLTVKTRLSFDELDNVVSQYSQGEYSISLGGLDESKNTRRKIMYVWFAQEGDRDRLRMFFAARSGKAPNGIPLPPGVRAVA